MATISLEISPQHPAFAGHFPGTPVVPGALLLDEAVRVLCDDGQLGAGPCEIAAAKFLSVVRPGESLRVEHERCEDGWVRFVISTSDRTVVSGRLTRAAIARDTDREV
jgi:3-hydroxymyristoyl/3-hydroxydecanoyl-(acyl carrier protein) dehydratase